jgi:hypothetical protein
MVSKRPVFGAEKSKAVESFEPAERALCFIGKRKKALGIVEDPLRKGLAFPRKGSIGVDVGRLKSRLERPSPR